MTSAVQAAIAEMEAERDRVEAERDRIAQAIETLKTFAGGGNGAAPKRASSGGGAKCSECGKVCATPGGLAVHKARAHGG